MIPIPRRFVFGVLSVGLLAAFLSAPVAAQVGNGDLARLWRDPVFQKRLMGSFGVNSEIEPVLSPEQQTVYDEVVRLMNEDQRNEAESLMKEALQDEVFGKAPGSALFSFTLGNLYFQAGRSRPAAAAFLDALKKFPDFRRAHQNLGIIYVQNGMAEKAIEHFTRTIQLGGADGPLFGLLGTSYIMTEQPVPAEAAFRNALLLTPEVDDWKLGLVRALFAQEKFKEALALLEPLLAKKPDDVTLWTLAATAHLGMEDLTAAAADYEILDLMGQATPEMLNTLGDLYANEGALAPAADAYLRAFEKNPEGPIQGPLRAADILVAREGIAEADELLEKVVEAKGDGLAKDEALEVKRLQARILEASDPERAAALLREVVEADPLDGKSLVKIGQYHAGKGENERAIFFYERAQAIEDAEAEASVLHAQLLVQMGKYAEAVPLLKRAQDIQPRPAVGDFLGELERYLKQRR